MFTLILTIYLHTFSQPRGTAAVTSVPGFTSQAACDEAAKRWLADQSGDADKFTRHTLCVRVSP